MEEEVNVTKILNTLEERLNVPTTVQLNTMHLALVNIFQADIINALQNAKNGPRLELRNLCKVLSLRESMEVICDLAEDVYLMFMEDTGKDKSVNQLITNAITKFLND